ncbi:MAG: glycosyltransferase family 4 protein [Dethiobacteria bacterium]|nr:glycosyltransferase family 4 protein [Bacillota bacterium]
MDYRHKQVLGKLMKELSSSRSGYEINLIKNMVLAKYPTVYKRYFDHLSASSDIIVHESPYLVEYDQELGTGSKPRIYNSHNHEFLLAQNTWKNQKAREYLPLLYQLEKKLATRADLVFAPSPQDRESFIALYNLDPGKVKVAPNGVNPRQWLERRDSSRNGSNGRLKALFVGANYPPNIEAVDYIVNHLAARCPKVEFLVAGGCCKPFLRAARPNVKLMGPVSHREKLHLFAAADLAVNPVLSGGGTNLKTLEFISAGLPLFSTEFGARGLNLVDKIHYVKAELDNFPTKINALGHCRKMLAEMAERGRQYVNEHYSWGAIAKRIKDELDPLLVG